MTTIEKVKAEIERLKIKYRKDILYKSGRESHASGYKIEAYNELLSFLDTLETEKPMNLEDAMKDLDEKIALVKQRGTWDGVDVDKYMDEVRGREPGKPVPADLEEAAMNYIAPIENEDGLKVINFSGQDIKDAFIAGAKWKAEKDARDMYMSDNRHFEKVYQLGRTDMREQMMKDAVEGEVIKDNRGNNVVRAGLLNNGFEIGDKVRVIVLKKED